MQIGDKVTSRLYADKGTGTILGFTDLFGESYVELFFSNGEKTSTSAGDIVVVDTLISKLQGANLEDPHAFLAKNMALRLTRLSHYLSENHRFLCFFAAPQNATN
ncbi:MAG TPA: hypothetical protein EYH38_04015 [Leucothrix sp.]|nr:hypothetical protein [Leucothrix sp.]